MKTSSYLLGLIGLFCLAACSKTEKPVDPTPEPGSGSKSKYVFVAYSVGSNGESAPYIVTADSISGGTLKTTGEGVETDAYSFLVQNNTLYAMVYGGQGPITPYKLNEQGKIAKAGNTVNAVTAGIYGKVNKDAFVGALVSRTKSDPTAQFFRFDASQNVLAGNSSVNLMQVAGNGEMAIFSGVFQVESDLYLPFYCSPGESGKTTKFVDSTYIAVLSYPAMQLKKVIRDGRTGTIGNWFGMHGVQPIENGDIYAYSTANGSKNPSGVVRIKKGTQAFDQSYFFNIEAKTGGLKISRGEHLSNGKFLMSIYTAGNVSTNGIAGGRVKLAIVDVINQSLTWVTGVPEHATLSYKHKTYLESDGNTVHYVLKEDAGKFAVYTINAAKAEGKRGLQFDNISDVTTIAKLTY
ncbi:DUF4374 domain-containing protein [Siphonobacter sp. SORGH_AS_1065]|uniref:DUF4374 domain-containing protein n=1 Tax=Siphonobacter sp. SORGH_AS_1065 TaxID=3041795 RepID=UPI0027886DC4|nr:DUF4374 domain-containing protein [Siphonobacter sp. SORGH_AS_1065]MDQ1089187.1 hypothetical protein [Siphonobacter sp. SORGH_AS_1065]